MSAALARQKLLRAADALRCARVNIEGAAAEMDGPPVLVHAFGLMSGLFDQAEAELRASINELLKGGSEERC